MDEKKVKQIISIVSFSLALAVPVLIYAIPHFGQKQIIANLDLKFPFWLYLVQFIVAVGLAGSLAKDFKEWVKPFFTDIKKTSSLVLLAAIPALFICLVWVAPRHRVQSDESIFFATAQNLYANQIAGSCDEGEFTDNYYLDCQKSTHNFKTKGEPFLYALGIPFFGHDLKWVFVFHIFLLLATIFLLYFAVRAWTDNPNLAFLTAAIFAAQPTTLFQFRAASVEPLYTFLFALSVFLWKWAWDRNTLKHWLLLALSLAFFAQTRQETVFCLGAFVIISAFRMSDIKSINGINSIIMNEKFSLFLLTISVCCIPVLLTISYYQGYNFQGGEFSAHGHFFENIKQAWNITVNTPLDKGVLKNPFLSSFTILAVCGLITLVVFAVRDYKLFSIQKAQKKSKSKTDIIPFNLYIFIFLVLYFPQAFMIFENVSGDLSIEINQRYTLILFPIMAFLAGYLIDKASLILPLNNRLAFIVITALVLWGNTFSYSESFKKNIMYNRNHLTTEEAEILKWLNNEPEKKRLFVYSRPWHFIGYGHSAIHYNSLNKQKLSELLKKYNGEVYYVKGLDCWDSQTYHKKAVETRIATVCDRFEQIFAMDIVFNTIITNNYRLVVAKLKEGNAAQLFPIQNINVELPENAQWLGMPSEYNQEWGTLQINKSVTGKPLTIANKRYKNGIGSHASGVLKYNLEGKYKSLSAVIGLDEDEFCSNGAQVKVLGDNTLLADTQKLAQGKDFVLNVSLDGVKQLVFEMDALGNINCDHVDIAVPILTPQSSIVD